MNILNKLLQTFLLNFTVGGSRLTTEALWLLTAFFGIELTLAGLWFVMRREVDWGVLLQRTLLAGVLLWLINNWAMLTKLLVRSFIQAGLKAGDNAISETDFTDPDNIAVYGLSITAVIFKHLSEYTGFDALYNIVEILSSGVTAWLVVAFYFGMAVWVFISLLEFYLSSGISIILLPWGMFSKTAWLTEKAIAHLFASAVRLLVLSFILGNALPVMYGTAQSLGTSFDAALRMFLGALALLLLSWRANGFAQGLIHGAPSLVLSDTTHLVHTLTTQVTRLGRALDRFGDTLARSDPAHSSRQSVPSQRRP